MPSSRLSSTIDRECFLEMTQVDSTARSARRGRLCILGAAVLWSISGVVAKGLDLDAGSIAFYRSFFAGLSLLLFVPARRMQFRPSMLPICVVFGAMVGLYIASMKATTAANAIFLQCTSTFWVVPLGLIVLKERPDLRSLIGIALATIGVVAIVSHGHGGTPTETRGIAYGLASGVGYAVTVIGMRGPRDLDSIWLSAIFNLGGSLVLAAWILSTGQTIAVPTLTQGLILAAFGIVQMAIPYALCARGLRDVNAAEAGLIGLLEPVLSPIWVAIGHGEIPHGPTLVGGAFLLAGVAARYVPLGSRVQEEVTSDA